MEDAGFATTLMVNDLCRTGVAVSLSSFVSVLPCGLNCSSDAWWRVLLVGRFVLWKILAGKFHGRRLVIDLQRLTVSFEGLVETPSGVSGRFS